MHAGSPREFARSAPPREPAKRVGTVPKNHNAFSGQFQRRRCWVFAELRTAYGLPWPVLVDRPTCVLSQAHL